MGSKSKIAKDITQIISSIIKQNPHINNIIEVFCGGCNLTNQLVTIGVPIVSVDSHFYLIEMYEALQRGWFPPTEVSRELYYNIKKCPSAYEPATVGFVGFNCSFGGKWWGGYATGGVKESHRNYAQEGYNHLTKQIKNLVDVNFLCQDYSEIEISNDSLVYCDPPYKGTTGYGEFDHYKFWDWVRNVSRTNPVLVSEYEAPDDFTSILDIPIKTSLDRKNTVKNKVEKLFVIK